jgi:hypothetical protein
MEVLCVKVSEGIKGPHQIMPYNIPDGLEEVTCETTRAWGLDWRHRPNKFKDLAFCEKLDESREVRARKIKDDLVNGVGAVGWHHDDLAKETVCSLSLGILCEDRLSLVLQAQDEILMPAIVHMGMEEPSWCIPLVKP